MRVQLARAHINVLDSKMLAQKKIYAKKTK